MTTGPPVQTASLIPPPAERPSPRPDLGAAARTRACSGVPLAAPHGLITAVRPVAVGLAAREGRAFHDGLDIATFCGDRIVAAHDGVVLAAGRKFDTQIGWVGDLRPYYARLDKKKLWDDLPISVVIDDGNGYRSIYAHFSKVAVKAGQTVKAGQLIGYEGTTGRATGCHVHYGLFSPLETRRSAIEPDVVKRLRVPPIQIARIDPLLVLPPRPRRQARRRRHPAVRCRQCARSSSGPVPSGRLSPTASPAHRRRAAADSVGRSARSRQPAKRPARRSARRRPARLERQARVASPSGRPAGRRRPRGRSRRRPALVGPSDRRAPSAAGAGLVLRADLRLGPPARPAQQDRPPAVGDRRRHRPSPGRRRRPPRDSPRAQRAAWWSSAYSSRSA